MRNWQAFKTHHKNQTAAAHERRRAIRGTTKGMKAGDASSGAAVAYCSACRAPVVESAAARKRHALKGGKCAEAMRDSGKNPNRREVELGSPTNPSPALPERKQKKGNRNADEVPKMPA